jgi:hypothetical protein
MFMQKGVRNVNQKHSGLAKRNENHKGSTADKQRNGQLNAVEIIANQNRHADKNANYRQDKANVYCVP